MRTGSDPLAGIGLLSVVLAAILSVVAPRVVGLAGYVYFLIGFAEWGLGDYRGRLRRRARLRPLQMGMKLRLWRAPPGLHRLRMGMRLRRWLRCRCAGGVRAARRNVAGQRNHRL